MKISKNKIYELESCELVIDQRGSSPGLEIRERRGSPRWTLGSVDAEGALLLLRSILADLLRLPGASCAGRHGLFEPVIGNGHWFERRSRST
jgi:hypothetical protein